MANTDEAAKDVRTIVWMVRFIIILLIALAILIWFRTEKTCVICRDDGDDTLPGLIDQSPCDSVTSPVPAVVVALTGGDSYEHEVHDCQRLVVPLASSDPAPSEYEFGPLVGVFPLDTAMKLERASDFEHGMAVATVYNWGGFGYAGDPRRYGPLDIEDGWNCLWLRHTGDRQDVGWSAAILPLGSADSTCAGASDTTGIDWNLSARHQIIRLDPSDSAWAYSQRETGEMPPEFIEPFPRTARWGWDSSRNEHYIGIRCGRAWCVVGRPGFTARMTSSATGYLDYKRTIPGWFDEEHLAVGAGHVVPGPWAAIYPTDSLYNLQNDAPADVDGRFTRSSGIEVAVMEVSRDPAGLPIDAAALEAGFARYDSKLNLDGNGVATIWLQLDGAMEPVSEYRSGPSGVTTALFTGDRGNARRYKTTMHAVMGAVRWRWLDTDQDQWEPCGTNACCDTGP